MKSEEAGRGQINDGPPEEGSRRNRNSGSNPLDIGRKRRGLFSDHTSLIAESYDTSGSYGSFDEESFVRQDQWARQVFHGMPSQIPWVCASQFVCLCVCVCSNY